MMKLNIQLFAVPFRKVSKTRKRIEELIMQWKCQELLNVALVVK